MKRINRIILAWICITVGFVLTVFVSSLQENSLYEYLFFFGGMPFILYGILLIPYPPKPDIDMTKDYYCEECAEITKDSKSCANKGCNSD